MFKQKRLLSSSSLMVAALCFGSVAMAVPAYADSAADKRVEALEQMLKQSLAKIDHLSGEVEKLKSYEPTKQAAPAKVAYSEESLARIEALEDELAGLDSRVGSRTVVNAFDAVKFDLGGFIHSAVTNVQAEDGEATSFNKTVFELLLKADLGDNWSAFVAQAFLRDSGVNYDDDGDGTSNEAGERRIPNFNGISEGPVMTDTPLAWVNYKQSDLLNVRFGRFITPHGIINIEHFPAILLDPEQPQFLRPFSGNTIFPNFLTGLQLNGIKFLGEDSLRYDVYTGNFTGNSENLVTGGRLGYTWGGTGLTLGVNASTGERSKTASSDYSMYGVDLLYDKGPLLWKTEFFSTSEDAGNDRTAWYTQPAWRLNDKWAVFYRYDFLDDGGTDGDTIENAIGVNFLPTKNVRLRATATNKEFESGGGFDDATSQIYQLSATVSF